MSNTFLQILLEIIFLTIIFLHISKKNFGAVLTYSLQSLAVMAILFNSFLETKSFPLLLIILFALSVKVILAPIFFVRLIKKYDLKFSVKTYFNVPLTLMIIAILTTLAHSQKFTPLTNIVPGNQALLSFALSSIFLSLFLIINSKEGISQIFGILSFENNIVVFAVFAGLEQSAMLQFGIVFDIFIWLIVAVTFTSLVFKQFGSLDVTSMRHLKD